MIGTQSVASTCTQYEMEIEIDASCKRVWEAIIHETNYWWLPDFHMVAPNSTVTFDPQPGGRGLIEETKTGGGLQWYSVQYYLPEQFQIYLLGHLAPDFGGPSTTHLKLALEARDGGCVLRVSDAHCGAGSEATTQSLQKGWKQLFSDGLKAHVEQGKR